MQLVVVAAAVVRRKPVLVELQPIVCPMHVLYAHHSWCAVVELNNNVDWSLRINWMVSTCKEC
jgi:hypothetical protein